MCPEETENGVISEMIPSVTALAGGWKEKQGAPQRFCELKANAE